jgi:hypothetical protein
MKSDIKFFHKDANNQLLLERFEISSGVVLANGFDIYQNRQYKSNAYKPKDDWRKINTHEKELLFTNDVNIDNNASLSLVKIPIAVQKIIEDIGFQVVNSYEHFINLFSDKPDLFNDLNLQLAYFLSEVIQSDKPLSSSKLLCFSYENPKIETIAYDQNDDKYFGLHLDCSEGAKVTKREKNTNRISINIGNEPRYLLYLNVSINTMIEMIKSKFPEIETQKEDITDRELVTLFFKHYPDYPVIRVKQEPFDAYIAPTDNIIHDGSTLDKSSPDMTIVFTGYFKTVNL